MIAPLSLDQAEQKENLLRRFGYLDPTLGWASQLPKFVVIFLKPSLNLWGSSLYLSLCVCVSLWVCLCVCVFLCLSVCVFLCPSVCVSAMNLCVFKYNAFVLRILLVAVLVFETNYSSFGCTGFWQQNTSPIKICLNYSSSLHAYIKFGGLLAPSRDILRSRLAGEDLDPRVVGLLGLASAASFDSGRDGGGCTKLLRSSSWKILKGGEISHFQASCQGIF